MIPPVDRLGAVAVVVLATLIVVGLVYAVALHLGGRFTVAQAEAVLRGEAA